MFRTVLEAVRREASGERALEGVRALSGFHRVQSSPGYVQAADWLAGQLASFGVAAEREMVPGDGRTRYHGWLMPEGWECTRGVATLVEGRSREALCDYACSKLALVLRSAPARGCFPLTFVEDGTDDAHYDDADVRGKLVLASGAAHEVYERAVLERGAVGLVCDGRRLLPPVRTRVDERDALSYTSFWWDESTPRGFGLVVTPERGDELRERLRQGRRLEVEVQIESRFFLQPFPLLSAVLPGRGAGEVLVVAHLCHPQPSANDNASGAAAALECARVLAQLRAAGSFGDAGRTVRILWVPELTGTAAYLARDPARATRSVAALNLDMVGERQEETGSTFLLEQPPLLTTSFAEELVDRIRVAAQDWVTSYSGPGQFSMTRLARVPFDGGSDHALLCDPAVGVPCPMLIQWPDRFYHSSHDTPDRSDPRSLGHAVRTAATYAACLSGLAVEDAERLAVWLGRVARERRLHALEAEEAPRAVQCERLRGERMLSSLMRLGLRAERVAEASAALADFDAREIAPAVPTGRPPADDRRNRRIPHRRTALALPHPRHLLPGWGALPREERDAWRRAARAVEGADRSCDLAWFACDGRRTVDQILELVWLETGQRERSFLERFFDLTARLGLSDWVGEEAPCKSDAPTTATR